MAVVYIGADSAGTLLDALDEAVRTDTGPSTAGLVVVQIVVTGTITLQFEASADRQATWVAISALPVASTTTVTSTTASGMWTVDGTGKMIRVRCSALTGGSAVVTVVPRDG